MQNNFLKKTPITNNCEEKIFWHLWKSIPGVGLKTFEKLYKFFFSMKRAWKTSPKILEELKLKPKVIQTFLEKRKTLTIEKEQKILAKLKIKFTTLLDQKYPSLLKEIAQPPPILYYKGSLPQKNEITLAVIGSRKYSFYGKQVTQTITDFLTKKGLTIVSGMALGIDSFAHAIALANQQKTYAILGCGLSQYYPPSNYQLAEKIIQEGGGILSEYPPFYQALRQNFHARNRIISGLSHGVLVIEAKKNSGTFITVNHALEQGRDIFAIPGNIFYPSSFGGNFLIQQGAKLITKGEDILEELKIPIKKELEQKKEKKINQKKIIRLYLKKFPNWKPVLEKISLIPLTFDKLVSLTRIKTSFLLGILTEMELEGIIEREGEKIWRKN